MVPNVVVSYLGSISSLLSCSLFCYSVFVLLCSLLLQSFYCGSLMLLLFYGSSWWLLLLSFVLCSVLQIPVEPLCCHSLSWFLTAAPHCGFS